MPSRSHARWTTERAAALDEIVDAHTLIGGTGRGRRTATQQINHAYAVLLSSQFQGFCRDLHSECVAHFIAGLPVAYRDACQLTQTRERKLDRGNPNPGNIGHDFVRLGLRLWPAVQEVDRRSKQRQASLEDLASWRNAIAHQDFQPVGGRPNLQLATVQRWRQATNGLAKSFEQVTRKHLLEFSGTSPW